MGIQVGDDGGQGFDLAVEDWAWAHCRAWARTDRAGGTLRIAIEPGEGTVVTMTVPF